MREGRRNLNLVGDKERIWMGEGGEGRGGGERIMSQRWRRSPAERSAGIWNKEMRIIMIFVVKREKKWDLR
jgi:hypothetical protein